MIPISQKYITNISVFTYNNEVNVDNQYSILTSTFENGTISKKGTIFKTNAIGYEYEDDNEAILSHFAKSTRIVVRKTDTFYPEYISAFRAFYGDETKQLWLESIEYITDTSNSQISGILGSAITSQFVNNLYWTFYYNENTDTLSLLCAADSNFSNGATYTNLAIPNASTIFTIQDIGNITGIVVIPDSVDTTIGSIVTLPWARYKYSSGAIDPNEILSTSYNIPDIYSDDIELEYFLGITRVRILDTAKNNRIIITVYSNSNKEYSTVFTINITDVENDPPYNQGGSSTSGGGGGSYGGGTFGGGGSGGQSSSDDIASTVPVGGANNSVGASTMLYTRYLLSQADLDFIGEWLWTPNLGLNIAKTFVSLAYGSPIDAIISVYAYPFSIGGYLEGYSAQQQVFCYGGARAAILGNAHMATALLNNAVSFNWGSLKIDEYWGNFLDYAPHTTVELYLPWGVGFVQLDPNQVMGRTLTVRTNIDLTKGTCVHNVFDDLGSVIGTYSGQCAKQLPMTSLDNASKIAGITAAAVGTIASATTAVGAGFHNATGGEPISWKIAGGESGTTMRPKEFNMESAKETFKQGTKPALASATALGLRPASVYRNGSFSDASSFMSVQYPYIILSRPTQSVPEEYGHHYGYPSNIYQGLRYLSGYTEIGEIHLQGIPCTESELSELDKMLKGGVLF